jgi:hypothetical protein
VLTVFDSLVEAFGKERAGNVIEPPPGLEA